MSRLIDADELGKVKFHPLPYTHIVPNGENAESYERGWNDAIDAIISDAQTVDAVPVSTLEQIKWERDSFAEQIREIGGEPFAKWDAMDIVKVVRCRDCKYYNERKVMNCSYHINAVKENWFCSQGEKVTE